MARPCAVCTSAARRAIDAELLDGQPYRAIARRYGMHAESARRHAKHHLAERLEQTKMLDIAAISARLRELDATARDVLAEDRARNHKLFWTGMDTSSRNLERLFRLTMGADLEARLRKLEEELTNGGDGGKHDGQPDSA